MLESIKTWIVTVLIGAFIVNIVDMILPSSKIKPYINLVVNFIFVFIILTIYCLCVTLRRVIALARAS